MEPQQKPKPTPVKKNDSSVLEEISLNQTETEIQTNNVVQTTSSETVPQNNSGLWAEYLKEKKKDELLTQKQDINTQNTTNIPLNVEQRPKFVDNPTIDGNTTISLETEEALRQSFKDKLVLNNLPKIDLKKTFADFDEIDKQMHLLKTSTASVVAAGIVINEKIDRKLKVCEEQTKQYEEQIKNVEKNLRGNIPWKNLLFWGSMAFIIMGLLKNMTFFATIPKLIFDFVSTFPVSSTNLVQESKIPAPVSSAIEESITGVATTVKDAAKKTLSSGIFESPIAPITIATTTCTAVGASYILIKTLPVALKIIRLFRK